MEIKVATVQALGVVMQAAAKTNEYMTQPRDACMTDFVFVNVI